jgi:hypothetical protein
MICCAGHFRQPLDGILVLAEQTGHLLVQLADLLVDQSQFLQRHLQQPPVDSVQLRTGTQRVAQLFRGGAQALIRQRRQSGRAGFPVRERLQHAPGTDAQQIRDEAGQLDMGLFQKSFQLVLQPYPIAPQLILLARHCPPQTLFDLGHKAKS